jgi:hypothetical protein
VLQGPGAGPRGIVGHGRAERRLEDLAFEALVLGLAAQDRVRPFQGGVGAARPHQLPRRDIGGRVPLMPGSEVGEEGAEPLEVPTRARPARHQPVPHVRAERGVLLGDLLGHDPSLRGVGIRPAREGPAEPDPALLQHAPPRPGQRVVECASRVEAGPGTEEHRQIPRIDRRDHPFVDRHHVGQVLGIEVLQQGCGPRQALEKVSLAE